MSLDMTDRTTNITLETLEHYNISYDSTLGDSPLENVNNPNIQDKNKRQLLLPIAPAECMFNSNGEIKKLELLNGGEISIGNTKKLDTWQISSIFPYINTTNLPYVIGSTINGVKQVPHPYQYFCDTLYYWKENSIPLVFKLKTWGSYYKCLIESFKFGVKDNTGDVWYNLAFCEYKDCRAIYGVNDDVYKSDYPADVYYSGEGEDICFICNKLYGNSDAYKYFMELNGMLNIEITPGAQYKIR